MLCEPNILINNDTFKEIKVNTLTEQTINVYFFSDEAEQGLMITEVSDN